MQAIIHRPIKFEAKWTEATGTKYHTEGYWTVDLEDEGGNAVVAFISDTGKVAFEELLQNSTKENSLERRAVTV